MYNFKNLFLKYFILLISTHYIKYRISLKINSKFHCQDTDMKKETSGSFDFSFYIIQVDTHIKVLLCYFCPSCDS